MAALFNRLQTLQSQNLHAVLARLWLRLGLLQHFHFVHMHGVAGHCAGNGNIVAFVALQGILVVNVDDGLVLVVYDDKLCACVFALFGAIGMARACAFRAALRIADPSFNRLSIRRRNTYHEKQKSKQTQHR